MHPSITGFCHWRMSRLEDVQIHVPGYEGLLTFLITPTEQWPRQKMLCYQTKATKVT